MNRRQAILSSVAGLLAVPGVPTLSEPALALADLQTFSAVGKERPILTAAKETEIFRQTGAGCLTHMWFATDVRSRIRIYIDGESSPSIDMAQDLGHGYTHGGPPEPWGVPQMGRQGGVYNSYRIPFGTEVRVGLLPTTDVFDSPTKNDAWWIIRGTLGLPVLLGGVRLPDTARLRLHRLEGYRAKPLEEFSLCDVRGGGAVFQVTLSAEGERPSMTWEDQSYQEGCVRAYLNGSKDPLFLSSGLEDYFVSAGYFHHHKLYQTALSGLTHLDLEKNRFVAYRFHDLDPIFYQAALRLTLRCGEELDGRVFHRPPPATYTAYTWIYQW